LATLRQLPIPLFLDNELAGAALGAHLDLRHRLTAEQADSIVLTRVLATPGRARCTGYELVEPTVTGRVYKADEGSGARENA
jgi:hypothetical protein